MKDNSDDLIYLAKHGDKSATVLLLQAYNPLLLRTARRYQGDGHYEDAYQEACVAFLEAISEWQGGFGVPFPAFVRAKVRGDVKSAMRRIWRYEERRLLPRVQNDGDTILNDLWDDERYVQHDATEHETGMYLKHLVCSAGLSEREVQYVRCLLEGQKPSDMVKTFGVSSETVKTWRKRALEKLRAVVRREAKLVAGG